MPKINTWLAAGALALAAFTLGRWNGSATVVKADSGDSPQIRFDLVEGQSSLSSTTPTSIRSSSTRTHSSACRSGAAATRFS